MIAYRIQQAEHPAAPGRRPQTERQTTMNRSQTITLAALSGELGITAPTYSYGTVADFFAGFDGTLEETYGPLTDDTVISQDDADAIREGIAAGAEWEAFCEAEREAEEASERESDARAREIEAELAEDDARSMREWQARWGLG